MTNLILAFVGQRWEALPGEPLPLDDDTEVDDWIPRFLVLQGSCIYLYSSSIGNLTGTFNFKCHVFFGITYFGASVCSKLLMACHYSYVFCLFPLLADSEFPIRRRIFRRIYQESTEILNDAL